MNKYILFLFYFSSDHKDFSICSNLYDFFSFNEDFVNSVKFLRSHSVRDCVSDMNRTVLSVMISFNYQLDKNLELPGKMVSMKDSHWVGLWVCL